MITKEMTPLQIAEKHPETVPVFARWDEAVGKCLLCHCLFDPLEDIAKKYSINLDEMLLLLCSAGVGQKEPAES